MLIQPPPPAKIQGAQPIIVINADAYEKQHRPERNEDFFSQSAQRALADALEAGYDAVSFMSVTEYVQSTDGTPGGYEYLYRWVFVPKHLSDEPLSFPIQGT